MGIFILSLVVIGVFSFGECVDDPLAFETEIKACLKEFDIAEDPVKSKKPLPADKQCYHKCVAQKIGLMDMKNQIQFVDFKAKLQAAKVPTEVVTKFEECSKVKKDDPCATAEAICNCVHGK